ncbi:hypothetical protein [Chitinophaga sp.]|uniref:hypothetical protein n=1 Tax=Chitinophaga sp. TaxID=1869181 RepID=UPI0031E3B766
MRYLLLSLAMLAACNPTREKTDTSHYEVISEKCFVLREKHSTADSAVNAGRDSIIRYLQQNNFPARYVQKDSLMFRRANAMQVEIVLPPPQDAWESNTIIVFDPQKNPLFVNLRKGTSQIQQYISGQ